MRPLKWRRRTWKNCFFNISNPLIPKLHSMELQEEQSIRQSVLQRQTQAIRCSFWDQFQYNCQKKINQWLKQLLLTLNCTLSSAKVLCKRFQKISSAVHAEPKLLFNTSDIVIPTVASYSELGRTQCESSVTAPTETYNISIGCPYVLRNSTFSSHMVHQIWSHSIRFRSFRAYFTDGSSSGLTRCFEFWVPLISPRHLHFIQTNNTHLPYKQFSTSFV